jgi:hypothetical protein
MIGMSLMGTFTLIKSSIKLLTEITSKETLGKLANWATTNALIKSESKLATVKGMSYKESVKYTK